MAENLYTVQKTYEALIDPNSASKEEQAIEKDLKFDDTRIFKTEFDRQMYLVSLTGDDLRAAIAWLKDSKNERVTKQSEMLKLLGGKQAALGDIQAATRKELASHALVIESLIPGVDAGGASRLVIDGQVIDGQVKDPNDFEVSPGAQELQTKITAMLVKDMGVTFSVGDWRKVRAGKFIESPIFEISNRKFFISITDDNSVMHVIDVTNSIPSTFFRAGNPQPNNVDDIKDGFMKIKNGQSQTKGAQTQIPTGQSSISEEVILVDKYTEIQDILGNKETDATSTVRKNAKAIVEALKKGTKLGEVKRAIDSLLDAEQDGEDFQKALGMTPDGGVIGPVTIKKFLEKAGVDTKEINTLMSKLQEGGRDRKSSPKDSSGATASKTLEQSNKAPKLTLDADGTIMNGKTPYNGTIKTPLDVGDGNTYSGEVKNGKLEGKGKYTLKSKDVYEGDFKNGNFEGKGKYTYENNGYTEEGIWKNDDIYNGVMKNKSGQEIAKYTDGQKVELKVADVAKDPSINNYKN
ncbi:MAG: hypothetical protein PHH70_05450 [Candidatus Gracilibacteria bacterium]|nr:hypothetical protein [Candidatus Gracilibacteria bacterium]